MSLLAALAHWRLRDRLADVGRSAVRQQRGGSPHASDLEGRGLVRAGQRAGQALYSATEEHDIRVPPGAPRATAAGSGTSGSASIDGEEVAYDDIAKGYESGDGRMVILTDEDFADLPLTTSREIDVLEFVPAEQVDPILLREDLLPGAGEDRRPSRTCCCARRCVQADRMAVVKVACGSGSAGDAAGARRACIVLQTMLWPDEVRTPDFGVPRRRTSSCGRRSWRWPRRWSRAWPATSTRTSSTTSTATALQEAHRRQGRGRASWSAAGRRPRTSPARSSTCWRRCSAASSGPAAARGEEPRHEGPGQEGRREEGAGQEGGGQEGGGEEGPRQEGRREEGAGQDHREDGEEGRAQVRLTSASVSTTPGYTPATC